MNDLEKRLFKIGLLVPSSLRLLKVPVAYLRYITQRITVLGKKGRPVIIVAMPKSGSTWMENIFMFLNSTKSVMPPRCVLYEQIYGNSHSQKIKRKIFDWARNKSVVIKLHASYSKPFYEEILNLNAVFILLCRDIEEASDSHVSYVSKTPFHPEFNSVRENEKRVKEKFERDMKEWISSWKGVLPEAVIVNYQEMLDSPIQTISRILNYYEIEGKVEEAIAYNSLERMKQRSPQKEFYRGSKFTK